MDFKKVKQVFYSVNQSILYYIQVKVQYINNFPKQLIIILLTQLLKKLIQYI